MKRESVFEYLNDHPDDIVDVLKRCGGMRISLFLPITTVVADANQNVTLAKDLRNQAFDQLMDNGLEPRKAKLYLEPIDKLIEEPQQLLRPTATVGLYIDESSTFLIDIPYSVPAQVTVGNRFTLKPLLPLLQCNSKFTIVCLNQGQLAVYTASRLSIKCITLQDMPTSIADLAKFDDPEKTLQGHVVNQGPAAGRAGSSPVAGMHGHGLPSELKETQARQLFNCAANAVKKFLANERSPIVVFGVDKNIGLFTSAVDWSEHAIIDVHQDPHKWANAEILARANEAMMPYWQAALQEKVENIEQAINKDNGIVDTGKCVVAAANGRVEMACVATDQTEPGICQPEQMEVKFVKEAGAGCAHDLLDTIAFETIQHGGEVLALPAEKIPGPGNTSAIVRF